MYQRDDGIVDFNSDACIGCKACIQACPYDAIYIDPEGGTAAKCHFCAHRTEVGLEPTCVVVCPEHAIIAGDMDDPTPGDLAPARDPGQRAQARAGNAAQAVLHRGGERDRADGCGPGLRHALGTAPGARERRRRARRLARPHPDRAGEDGGRAVARARPRRSRKPGAPRETYNVPHRVPWHWQVPAVSRHQGDRRGRVSSWPPPESLWGSCPPSRSLRRSLPSWRSSSSASPWACWCGTWTARSGSGRS